MSCLYCGRKFRSAMALACHMDTRHESWVEAILAQIADPLPGAAPAAEWQPGNGNGAGHRAARSICSAFREDTAAA